MSTFKVPPAIESHAFTGVAASGGGEDWVNIDGIPVDDSVNGFVFDKKDQKLLLVWGKSGFGKGRYLPVIAPLPQGTDPKEAVTSATKKQTGGIEATEVTDVGGFFITVEGAEGHPPYVSFGRALWISAWTGEPSETETRKPEWVASPTRTDANESLPSLPIDKMFEDERYWYPHFFAGRRVIGRVDYAAPENPEDMVGKLNRYWFGFTD